MGNALIIFKQTVIMFLYMAVGFAMFRARLITKEGSSSIANLLLYVVIPAVLVQSFQVEYSPEKAAELLVSFAVGALLLLVSMVISHLFYYRYECTPGNDYHGSLSGTVGC